jgi:hypothetical protein
MKQEAEADALLVARLESVGLSIDDPDVMVALRRWAIATGVITALVAVVS